VSGDISMIAFFILLDCKTHLFCFWLQDTGLNCKVHFFGFLLQETGSDFKMLQESGGVGNASTADETCTGRNGLSAET